MKGMPPLPPGNPGGCSTVAGSNGDAFAVRVAMKAVVVLVIARSESADHPPPPRRRSGHSLAGAPRLGRDLRREAFRTFARVFGHQVGVVTDVRFVNVSRAAKRLLTGEGLCDSRVPTP